MSILDATDLAMCEELFNDPNILAYWRTGSYYLFGKTTTDRDIVCMCEDVVAACDKYAGEYKPAGEDADYDSISVKFDRLPLSNGPIVTFNLILVSDWHMYSAWVKASEIAVLLNVTDKPDRVTLFTRFQEMALEKACEPHPKLKATDNDDDF